MSFSPTAAAFRQPRFVLLAAILLCVIGVLALLDFPATEEPGITMRTATVQAYLPGEPADRVERMLARPIEEAIRAETEVRTVDTQVRPGSVLVYVTLRDQTGREETAATWQKLRGRLNDLRPDLPAATTGLRLDDDFGRVAVRTIAVTGKGYDAAQLELWAKHIRNRLLGVPGTAAVSLHGVRREIAYVDLNPDAVRAAGTSVAAVAKAFADRDGSAPTGQLLQGSTSIAVQAGDRFTRASDLAAFPVAVAAGRTVPLGSLGTIRQAPQDPPQGGAFYNGQPAVVIGVAMQNGQNVLSFAEGIDARMAEVRASLPAGLHADTITDQAEVVEKQLKKVGQVFLETVVIVLGIVMLFLGWRSGLVTGVIVPMTVLGTALIMNLLGIELHQISIAAIIIALGIFVDNGIVVVEDYERQVGEGVAARPAAIAAGQSMLAMLLLFVWQFGSVRKGLIVIASMPFALIGATLGLAITGQPLSFSATIGILALAGIIVNNAVLLLGRIAEDRDAGMPLDTAIAHAAEMRLRPIVMTKLVCIAGLAPLYLFGGDLWRPMAAAMMGGLALGTLITLVLIPALYFVAFRRRGDDRPTTTLMGDVQ